MRIPYFQVNAFTQEPFAGNPAGVCLLEKWLPDPQLQSVAAENNLSETAFLVREADGYRLRWMTPTTEVDLCGHATLASAHVLFFERACTENAIQFQTLSGKLSATRLGDMVELNFPSRPPQPCTAPPALLNGLGRKPMQVLKSRDFLAVYESLNDVTSLQPDMDSLCLLDSLGVIVTAPGQDVDFVSRFFAPKVGVPEDPVTGSAHCSLIPYWAERLGKRTLRARQISRRGGELLCELKGTRVALAGHAVVYCRGELQLC